MGGEVGDWVSRGGDGGRQRVLFRALEKRRRNVG